MFLQTSSVGPALEADLVQSSEGSSRWIWNWGHSSLHKSTTHLLVGPKASQTEKFLLSVARGIPIVHTDDAYEALAKKTLLSDASDAGDLGRLRFPLETLDQRRSHFRAGGKFRDWKVLLLMPKEDDDNIRTIYERVLKAAGANVLQWDEEMVRREAAQGDVFPGLTHIFSEPDVVRGSPYRAMVAKHRSKTASYYYIGQALTKPTMPPLSVFHLDRVDTKMIHVRFQRLRGKKQETKLRKSLSNDMIPPSLTKNVSLVLAPDADLEGLGCAATPTGIKRKASSDCKGVFAQERKRRNIIEPFLCSPQIGGNATPRRPIMRRPSAPSKSSSNSGQMKWSPTIEEEDDDSKASSEKTLLKLVNTAHDFGAYRRHSLYGADLGVPTPFAASERKPSFRLTTAEHLFNQAVASYMDGTHLSGLGDDEAERATIAKSDSEMLWSQLREMLVHTFSAGSDHIPSKALLWKLVTYGLLGGQGESPIVRGCAHGLLQRWATFCFPPTGANAAVDAMYIGCMTKKETFGGPDFDPFAPWEFLSAVIDRVLREAHGANGPSLLLDWITTVLKINFECRFKTGEVHKSLFYRVVWPEGDSLRVTVRVEKLVKSLLRSSVLHGQPVANARRLVSLVGMAAQCLAIGDVDYERNTKKMELVACFKDKMKELNLSPDDLSPAFLPLMSPNWLSLLLTQSFISSSTRSEENFLSLRQTLGSLSIMDKPSKDGNANESSKPLGALDLNTAKKAKAQQPGFKKKASTNPNKRNKYGETPLHIACKKGDSAKLCELLTLPGVDVNSQDHSGWTALHEAAGNGCVECVKMLLQFHPRAGSSESVVDLGIVDLNHGITPLQDAVSRDRIDVAEAILQAAKTDDRFPSVSELLSHKSTDGAATFDHAVSEPMRDLLKRHQASAPTKQLTFASCRASSLRPLKSSADLRLLHHFLASYLSEFSLHFVKQEMKMKAGQRGRFKASSDVASPSEEAAGKRYLVYRSETDSARDLRTFNLLKEFRLEGELKKMQPALDMIAKR